MKKIACLLTCLILLSSCYKKELNEIELNQIFLVDSKKYIVCFYSSTCDACNKTLEVLDKRYSARKYEGFLLKTDNLDSIYFGEKRSNLFVGNYQNIVISTLPYLIFIEKRIIVKELFGYTQIHKENLYIFFE